MTNPQSPVKCGVNEFEVRKSCRPKKEVGLNSKLTLPIWQIAPLNDFKSGKYWVRIGQADTNTWTYSGVFDFEGKGTVSELKVAGKRNANGPPVLLHHSPSFHGAIDGAKYPSAEGAKDGKTTTKDDEKKGDDKKQSSASASASAPMSAMPSGASSSVKATQSPKGTNSVSAGASRSLSISIASGSSSNAPKESMPSVKKDAKNEEKKKSTSGAGSEMTTLNLAHQAAVMTLASLAAYVLS